MNSLSYKIGLGYFIIIIFNIFLAVFAIYHINNMTQPLDKILKENYRNINSAENMKLAFTQQELTQLAMIESSVDSANRARFNQYKKNFSDWWDHAFRAISLPAEHLVLDSLEYVYKSYLLYSDSLQKLISKNIPYIEYKSYHYNTILPLASEITTLCNRLKEVNEHAIFEADNRARAISFNAQIFISVFAVIIIGISVIAGVYFTRQIIRPLKMTTDSVRKIRKGQVNQKVAITTNDEIAELGIEFNSMTDRMNKYLKEVSGLKELDHLKSNFMAIISHEFKTPLTSLNMVIDILQKESKGNLNEIQKELLTTAKQDVTRLKQFAYDLLELSRLESGTKKFELQTVHTKELLETIAESFNMLLKDKNIKIKTVVDQRAEKFTADKEQILRVLSNLMDNAIRFSADNSIIKITAQKRLQDIQFAIEDRGKGIDPRDLDLIFDKFIQTENPSDSHVGLGLAIAKEIVEQHQGEIWAESTPGKGSVFCFTIPQERKDEN